jgi:hypothetical protein
LVTEDLRRIGSPLPIAAGSVSINGDAAVRRSLSATIIDPDSKHVPKDTEAALNITGAEVAVRSGIRYPDGTEETFPAGVFGITSLNVEHSDGGTLIQLSGLDRAERVQVESTAPIVIPANTSVAEAVRRLVTARYSTALFTIADRGDRVGNLLFPAGEDLWAKARDLAVAMGEVLSFDVYGRCVSLNDLTGSDATRVLTYGPGQRPTMNPDRVVDRDQRPNGVIVVGTHSATDGTIRGEAWDTRPGSATRRGGRYGDRPVTIESQFVSTVGGANALALAELNKRLGPADRVTFSTVPNAAHDIGDVIRVEDDAIGATGLYVIEQIDFPFAVTADSGIVARRPVS